MVELPAEPTGPAPEVFISPGLSTTFTFDTELSRGEGGREGVALERREAFSLVDGGQTTLRLTPSDKLVQGARLQLSVRFRDGAAPSGAAFILVVHPVQAERLVEVYREARPVEFYQREALAARREADQLRAELERERAGHATPGGLAGLLAGNVMDSNGVRARNLEKNFAPLAPGVPSISRITSYRSAHQVALEVLLEYPGGTSPWVVTHAMLTDEKGVEVKVVQSWQSGTVLLGNANQHVVVQADARESEALGTYVLKLWDENTGRAVILTGVSFP